MSAYNNLKEKFNEIGVMAEISSILSWDANVMMPQGSSEVRGEQMAYLSTKIHQITTGKDLSDKLESALSNAANLSDWDAANLKAIKREVNNATVLPEKLVAGLTTAQNKCEILWRDAKPKGDFNAIAAPLQELLNLTREKATRMSELNAVTPYEALVDQFDPYRKTSEIDSVFGELESVLPHLIKEVIERQPKYPTKDRNYPAEKQKELVNKYLKTLNFDFSKGRLDESSHPFCGGIPEDSRITTRYNVKDFTSSLAGVVHEGGHSLYERNLPKAWRRQPVGSACGMAIHESQSLFVEKQLCMNQAFLRNVHKDASEIFGMPDFTFDELLGLTYLVQPSFIRVDADEVTYPLHVIFRYKIERDLINGKMEVKDIPDRWNGEIQNSLGITPPNHTLGCLQDIHWFFGGFGYFPSYTLGALTAAQLMHKVRQDLGDVDAMIGSLNFGPILNWLGDNIHANASRYTPSELVKVATGETLNAQYFIDHIRSRYLK